MEFYTLDNARTEPDIRGRTPPAWQSQYSTSPIMRGLALAFAERMDPARDMALFYSNIFNIMTARGVGLDIWGRILGITRRLEVEPGDVFGFSGSLLYPLDQGTFHYPGVTKRHSLSDAAFRELLLFKAMSNISNATLATLNTLLARLYPGRTVFVLEVGVMCIRVVFLWALEPWQRSIFKNYGLLNKGAGVGFQWLEVEPQATFGFCGSGLQPLNCGAFHPYPLQRG